MRTPRAGAASARGRVARVAGAACGAMLLAAIAAVVSAPSPDTLLARTSGPSVTLLDRHGRPLRFVPDPAGVRRRPLGPEAVGPYLLGAVLAAEDRRFFVHPGIDPLALARAAWQDLRARRIVSGGSTLTMQLARICDPRPRTVRGKLVQMAEALRLELALSKREILAAYLSRAPMGNRVTGFAAAAEVYLGKPVSQLSPAEAALLAAIPRSPSAANPWRGGEALRRRRDAILARMARLAFVGRDAAAAAAAEPVVLAADPFAYPAPHFIRRVLDELGPARASAVRVTTTLSPELQRRVEVIVRRRLAELAAHGVTSMAVAVLDVTTGEWLALEGSGGFWDAVDGQLDGTRTPRQPGSALKPFTYAAAFDRGLSPASVLPDIPRAFTWAGGTWTPRNYDGRFHGPLLARQALACSVNVPAAVVLDRIGPTALLDTLRRGGITTLTGDAGFYGLGLTLGAGEVRLDELTVAYAALLRGGEWRPARAWRVAEDEGSAVVARPPGEASRRICSPQAAAQVVDVLADPEARAPAFGAWSVLRLPFSAAVKTGTSEGFRDNWCVGGTAEVAVGVWCGSFARAPMGNVSGVAGAGDVWREVVLAWAELFHPGVDLAARHTLAPLPPGLRRVPVCALSGLRATAACPRVVTELLRPEQAPRRECDWHVRDAAGRVAEVWPPLYRDWAAGEGRLAAPEALRSAAPVQPRGEVAFPEILAPADGDAFIVVPDLPRRFQTLELRCAVPGRPSDVTWRVDGRELARPPSPYAASWALEPGRHVITVEAGGGRSAPVTVEVHGG